MIRGRAGTFASALPFGLPARSAGHRRAVPDWQTEFSVADTCLAVPAGRAVVSLSSDRLFTASSFLLGRDDCLFLEVWVSIAMTVETEPMAKVAKRLQRQSRMHPLATPWIYIAALHERLTANSASRPPWAGAPAARMLILLATERSKQRVWVVAVAITFAALRFWVGEHYGDGDSDVARSASRNKVHSPFMLPPVPAPVPETMDAFVLDNHPVSPWRPQRQFWTPIPHQPAPPVFGLATIFQRTPDLSLLQVSYESLRAQSFQRWDWYLIDLRPQPTTLALEDLESFAKLDPRIKVVRREGLKTLTDGRNAALDLFRSSGALYASFLQPNALLELTMLEKAAWTLATVTDWDMVGFFEAQFGASRAVYHHGIHSGARNLNEVRFRSLADADRALG